MNTAAPGQAVQDGRADTVSGWQLGRYGRLVLLAAHITVACIWIGALVVMLLLICVQDTSTAVAWRPGLDRAQLLIYDRLVVNASYGFIVTGLMFTLFTHWGALRFWWVALKWGLVIGLGIALPLWVAPHVSGITALSDAFSGLVSGNTTYDAHVDSVMLATGIQLLVLVCIVSLSVFKPWGRRKARFRWPRWLSLSVAAVIVVGLAGQLWVQNVQLAGYRRIPVAAVDVSALPDGTYDGEETQAGFTYRVRVTVDGGRIAHIEILSNRESHYAQLAALAADKLVGRPRNDVDGISGATTTSKGLMRAVANAFTRAPGRVKPGEKAPEGNADAERSQ